MDPPIDNNLNAYAHGALDIFEHKRGKRSVVTKVNSIPLVVIMLLFGWDEGISCFFPVEKFVLGVVATDDVVR